ncbi:MAG: type IV secretory system conjugative DNA transfer family protein, partial [Geminicoccaceae bacterium]|nr:type IV secretory system conjugative DNA transfer family protein [Geminicoccaceae bacterium]
MNRAWIASLMGAGMACGAGYAWMNGMAAPQLVQMGAMGLAAGGMIAGMARRMGPPKVQAKAQDKWASETALERAGLLRGDGIVLGRMGERYVTLQRPGHALVIGGTRSGKTSGVIVPTLLNWT